MLEAVVGTGSVGFLGLGHMRGYGWGQVTVWAEQFLKDFLHLGFWQSKRRALVARPERTFSEED